MSYYEFLNRICDHLSPEQLETLNGMCKEGLNELFIEYQRNGMASAIKLL